MRTIVLIIVILMLGASTVFFAIPYFTKTAAPVAVDADAKKSLMFLKLFIAKVLRAEGDVRFEDRLQLENGIHKLQNPRALLLWKEFVDAKSSDSAQRAVKNLLELLVDAIRL